MAIARGCVIRLPCVHIALSCLSSAVVCAHVYMANSEPRGGEPLLIQQLCLTYVSLYDTLLCQVNIADCSHYTHLCMWTYILYENVHIIAHRYCVPNVSYNTAIARSVHSMLHMQ